MSRRPEWIEDESSRADLARELGLDAVGAELDRARAEYLEAVRRLEEHEDRARIALAEGRAGGLADLERSKADWREARSAYERIAERANAAIAAALRRQAETAAAPKHRGPGRPTGWTPTTWWAAYREARDRAGGMIAADKTIAASIPMSLKWFQELNRRHGRPPD